MNIHRELAIYRILACRAHEQLLAMRDHAQSAGQNTDPESDAAHSLWCAMDRVVREQGKAICHAYEDRGDGGATTTERRPTVKKKDQTHG